MRAKLFILGLLFFAILFNSCKNKNTSFSFGLYNSTKDTIYLEYVSYGEKKNVTLMPSDENDNPIIYFNYEEFSENKKEYSQIEFSDVVSTIKISKNSNNLLTFDNLSYKNDISNWKYEFDNDFFEYNHLYVLNISDSLFYYE
jgi:hypothetical protein